MPNQPDSPNRPADPPAAPPDGATVGSGGAFDVSHIRPEELRRRTAGGAAVTVAGQAVNFGVVIGGAAVLGRMLEPADFGLFAMAAFFIGLANFVRDAGLTQATIQRERLDEHTASALFWFNAGFSLLVGVAVAASAPLVVRWYGEPAVFPVLIASGAVVFAGGISLQHQALLSRRMQFKAVALSEVIARAAGLLAAVAVAALAMREVVDGVWALLAQQAAYVAVLAAGWWWWAGWVPQRPRRAMLRDADAGAMLAFGGWLTAFNFVNYFARNADNALIGRAHGEQSLGHYSRAYGLLTLPLRQLNTPITQVVMPALSRAQGDPDEYRRVHLQGMRMVAATTVPLALLLVLLSREAVLITLGSQWGPAVPIFRYLAVSAPVQPLLNATGWLYLSLGQTRRMFNMGLATAVVTCGAFLVGLPYGAQGVALAYSVVITLWTPVAFWHATRRSPVRLGEVLRAVAGPATAALLAAGVGCLSGLPLPDELPLIARAVVVGSVFGVTYLALMYLFFGGRADVAAFRELRAARKARRDKPSSAPGSTGNAAGGGGAVAGVDAAGEDDDDRRAESDAGTR